MHRLMTTVSERLKAYLNYKHVRKSHFEKQCGLCNGYVNGIRKNIGAEKMEIILRNYPDLNKEWLLWGEGEMLVQDKPAEPVVVEAPDNSWQVKMYEDLLAESERQIRELKVALYSAQHRVEELEAKVADLLKKAAV